MTEPELTIGTNGTKRWYLNGELHREDGPAIECSNGTKFWYLNGGLCSNGTKFWYLNGGLHRTDGPAVEYTEGTNLWYLNGKLVMRSKKPVISKHMQEKFERLKKEFYASQVVEG